MIFGNDFFQGTSFFGVGSNFFWRVRKLKVASSQEGSGRSETGQDGVRRTRRGRKNEPRVPSNGELQVVKWRATGGQRG
jgi:hypothetical protein